MELIVAFGALLVLAASSLRYGKDSRDLGLGTR